MKLQDLLEELKKDYLVALPQKIERIKDLTTIKEWPLVQEEFHKLKGTGKTYGFPEVSVLGEFMEKYYRKNPHSPELATTLATSLLEKILTERKENRTLEIALDLNYIELQKINSEIP